MKNKFLKAALAGMILMTSNLVNMANANLIVTWENNANDLIIRWDGNISNWGVGVSNINRVDYAYMYNGNGLHALDGNVEYVYTGTSFNWYTGVQMNRNYELLGDSWGSSGTSNWAYMPGGYAGENISGQVTFFGAGSYVAAGFFHEGSRDLGLGDNDTIFFQAYNAVPEPTTLAIFALGMIGLASRRFKKQS
jgi:hypothetical protein